MWHQSGDLYPSFFGQWSILIHPDKLEGLSTTLTVQGIELDPLALHARLPKDKFDHVTSLLNDWLRKKHCEQKEMASLIGHLHHACKVVPQQMIDLSAACRRDDHQIRLDSDFHLDLFWWQDFFHSWDGTSFFLSPQWAPLPDFQENSLLAAIL